MQQRARHIGRAIQHGAASVRGLRVTRATWTEPSLALSVSLAALACTLGGGYVASFVPGASLEVIVGMFTFSLFFGANAIALARARRPRSTTADLALVLGIIACSLTGAFGLVAGLGTLLAIA